MLENEALLEQNNVVPFSRTNATTPTKTKNGEEWVTGTTAAAKENTDETPENFHQTLAKALWPFLEAQNSELLEEAKQHYRKAADLYTNATPTPNEWYEPIDESLSLSTNVNLSQDCTLSTDTQNVSEQPRQAMPDSYSKKEIDLMLENQALRIEGRFNTLETLIKDGFQANKDEVKAFEHKMDLVKKDVEKSAEVMGTKIDSLSKVLFSLLIPVIIGLATIFAPIAINFFLNVLSKSPPPGT